MELFNKKNRGATLLETVVYVAIFSVLSVMLVETLALAGSSFRELRATRTVTDGGLTAMDRITREIRLARDVSTSFSTFDATPGTLSLVSRDLNGIAQTISFGVASTTLRITEGVTASDLLPAHLVVDSLIFRHTSSSSRDVVKIELTIHDDREKTGQTHSFYATAAARGSY